MEEYKEFKYQVSNDEINGLAYANTIEEITFYLGQLLKMGFKKLIIEEGSFRV